MFSLMFIITSILCFTACSKDDDKNFINNGTGQEEEYIYDIEIINGPSMNVKIGDSDTLKINYEPAYLAKPMCKWVSSDWTIVSIDRYSGKYRAVSEGKCTITVTTSITTNSGTIELTDECEINVSHIDVEKIEFDVNEKEIEVGEEFTLTTLFTPENSTNKHIEWSSSDSTIATVNKGTIKGIKEGECVITATTLNYKVAECILIVKPASVQSIELNTTEVKLEVGGKEKINFNIFPSYAKVTDIEWSVENENIASISDDGIITCKNIGKTKAKITINKKHTAECTIIGCDIDEFVEIAFMGYSGMFINGYITGNISFSLVNNSSHRIVAEKLEIVSSNNGYVKYSESLNNKAIEPNSKINYTAQVNSIYKPIFKLHFTYNNKTYIIEKQLNY